MRLLLWVLLLALVTLLASTDAASSKNSNSDSTKTSKVEAMQAPVITGVLSPQNIADGRRSLRIHNDDITNNEYGDESYTRENDEERAISISSILDKFKTSKGNLRNSMSKKLDKINDALAMPLYRMGETPVSLKAKTMRGGLVDKKSTAFYKRWYDKNVASGAIKALD